MKELKTLAQAFNALATSTQKGIHFISQSEKDEFISYRDFRDTVLLALGHLQALGLKPGDELILQISDLKKFTIYFWASILGKIIPIPLELTSNQEIAKKLLNIWKVLNNPHLIYDEEANILKLKEALSAISADVPHPPFSERSFLTGTSDTEGEVKDINPHDYCYIQFSSGSTGVPKGAPVTHKNLMNNIYDMIHCLNLTTDDSFISWKPLVHDFSMIAFHMMPLVLNSTQFRMTTNHFVWNPGAWFSIVDKYRISVLGSPNFGLRHFLNHYQRKKAEARTWDLSCVKMLMNGAETISSKLLQEFISEMKAYNFNPQAMLPVWGLAEATLMATRSPLNQEPKIHKVDRRYLNIGDEARLSPDDKDFCIDFVDVGEPLERTKIRITDDANSLLEEGKIGHIQIQGVSVISKYYNNAEASQKVIKDGWVDTGDIGFMKNGRLVFTGRAKEIIIVNGVNYFPFDIEECLLSELGSEDLNKYVACGAYNFSAEKEELLVFVYFKGKNEAFAKLEKGIKEIVLRRIGLVVDQVIPTKQIPKTTSGKIMRHQLAAQYMEGKYAQESKATVATPVVNHFDNEVKDQTQSVKTIQQVILKELRNILGNESISIDRKFSEVGVKSLHVVPLIKSVNENLRIDLQVSDIFDNPTVSLLTNFIQRTFGTPQTMTADVQQSSKPMSNDDAIAIVGMGCRFPAKGNTPEEFWNALINGIDGIVEVPADRWDNQPYFDENKEAAGKMYTKLGGFLDIPVDEFDANFFNLSPKEAKSLDPQQRLLLEVSWEAFEDAAIDTDKLNNSNTGVFLGMSGNDYLNAHLHSGNFDSIDAYSLTGTAFSTAAGRLSYFFGLQGPCFAVDTACSSTLVALHLAFQSLQSNEINMALVGGSHLILGPYGHIGFSKLGAISVDGHSKSFDASANGYARSEGCGVIIMKRLSDALKDNDKILAVVRGTATNQDGKSNGLTAPSGAAQQKVILSALKSAGLNAEEVDYVETHGTGTPLGDPIEVNAIANVYGKGRTGENPILIGSVKSNVGHLEPVAGLAGLVKIIKSFENETIPANLNFNTPNPYVDWDKIAVKVIDKHQTWHRNGKVRRAGINSFGFGGSNAHIILEEPPVKEDRKNDFDRDCHVLNFSAKNREALLQLADRYIDHFKNNQNQSLGDVCFTANIGRTHFRNDRVSICGKSTEDVVAKLKSFVDGNIPTGIFEGSNLPESNQIVFLYTGQGSQYLGIAKTLYNTNQVFKEAFDACDKLFYPYLLKSIKDVIDHEGELINRTDFAQPIIFSVQIALTAVWKSFGIVPHAVAGHSIGEFAAAVTAEILTLEEAVRIVAARGRLMNSAPGHGKMIAAFASEQAIENVIAHFKDTLSIAAVNLEESVVISGEAESLDKLIAILASKNIETRPLVVSHAFHSPLMYPILDDFRRVAASVTGRKPVIEFVSTLTGNSLDDAPDANYWSNHLRNTVRFYAAMKCLAQKGYKTFLEIGGTPTLSSLGKKILPSCLFLHSLKEKSNDWQQISNACAALYTQGFELDWAGMDKTYARSKVTLPHYPFQRKKYWMDLALEGTKSTLNDTPAFHPVIGQKISSPAFDDTVVYQSVFTSERPYFMSEHIIYDAKISPAAAHVSTLLSIVQHQFGYETASLEEFDFLHPLVVNDEEERLVQFIIKPNGTFLITSRDHFSENSQWQTHCTGKIDHKPVVRPEYKINIEKLLSEFTEEITHEGLYGPLREIGFSLGEGFTRIMNTRKKGMECLCLLEEKSDVPNANVYREYPGVIDSIFQTSIPVSGFELAQWKAVQNIFIPYTLASFKYYKKFPSKFYCYTKSESQDNFIKCDIKVISEDGEILAEIHDLMGKRTDRATLLKGLSTNLNKFTYEVHWDKQVLSGSTALSNNKVMVFADSNGYSDALIQTIMSNGGKVVKVTKGARYFEKSNGNALTEVEINPEDKADFFSLFNAYKSHTNLLYCWGMDCDAQIIDHLEKFQSNQKELFSSLILITNSIVELSLENYFSLRIITAGAMSNGYDNAIVNTGQSTLWGFARTLAIEYPELYKGVVDVESVQSITDGELVREIGNGTEQQVLLKDDRTRFVSRFRKVQVKKSIDATIKVDADASYLITGGMGSLGLLFCDWLIQQGARNIVLTGRSELDEAKCNVIQLLQSENVKVQYIAADIADESSVNKLFKTIQETLPTLKGIIHAAGILDDGTISSQNWDKFNNTFKSKVWGTINLHHASLRTDLDFFVLFSSLAAVIGSAGQSNYSAANEFLNQFANYRRAIGLSAKSFAWGPWSEIGMAAAQGNRGERLLKQGIISIKPTDGLKLFESLLLSEINNPVVVQFDWKTYGEKLNPIQAKQFFVNHIVKNMDNQQSVLKEQQDVILQNIKDADPDDRFELLLNFNRQLAAKIAGFDDFTQLNVDAPIMEQGFDSIMAVDIRNTLAKSLNVELSASLFFNYPSISAISKYLLTEHLKFGDAVIQESHDQSGIDLLKEINELIEM